MIYEEHFRFSKSFCEYSNFYQEKKISSQNVLQIVVFKRFCLSHSNQPKNDEKCRIELHTTVCL